MSLYIYVLKIIDLLEQNMALHDVLLVRMRSRRSLEYPSKDYDIEVYGLSYAQIRAILSPHSWTSSVNLWRTQVGRGVDVATNANPRSVLDTRFSMEATSALGQGSFCAS